jgi:hypothetical protein
MERERVERMRQEQARQAQTQEGPSRVGSGSKVVRLPDGPKVVEIAPLRPPPSTKPSVDVALPAVQQSVGWVAASPSHSRPTVPVSPRRYDVLNYSGETGSGVPVVTSVTAQAVNRTRPLLRLRPSPSLPPMWCRSDNLATGKWSASTPMVAGW